MQRSGYPEAYADHEQQGRVLASTLTGQSPAGFGCRLADWTHRRPRRASRPGSTRQFGAGTGVLVHPRTGSLTLTARRRGAGVGAGQWAVANADGYGLTAVEVAGQRWTRGTGDDALGWNGGGSAGATTVVLRTT